MLNCYHSFPAFQKKKKKILVFESVLCVQTHMQRQSVCQDPERSGVK